MDIWYQEIWFHIASFLELAELIKMMMVCRFFRDFIGNSALWNVPEIPYRQYRVNKMFKKFLSWGLGNPNLCIQPYYGEAYYFRILYYWSQLSDMLIPLNDFIKFPEMFDWLWKFYRAMKRRDIYGNLYRYISNIRRHQKFFRQSYNFLDHFYISIKCMAIYIFKKVPEERKNIYEKYKKDGGFYIHIPHDMDDAFGLAEQSSESYFLDENQRAMGFEQCFEKVAKEINADSVVLRDFVLKLTGFDENPTTYFFTPAILAQMNI